MFNCLGSEETLQPAVRPKSRHCGGCAKGSYYPFEPSSRPLGVKNPPMCEAGLWINPDYIRRQVKRLTKQSAKNIITLSDTTKLQPVILCHADAVCLSFPIKCRNLISLSCVLIYVSFLWLIHHHHIFFVPLYLFLQQSHYWTWRASV